jgi:4-diphosphocytidyl-2-C-methyl-D-erythritol kinase
MIMQQVELHDLVNLSLGEDEKIVVSSNMPGVPLNENNLAWRAASLIREEFGLTRGVNIHLDKQLPMEAGLAGGSSNGAAVLRGMNRLFRLECSLEKLIKLAAKLGADMPFCVLGGTALATGIGEILTPLENKLKLNLILIKPPFGVSTKEIYGNLRLEEIKDRPNNRQMVKALAAGEKAGVAAALGNVLEMVTIRLYPGVGQIKDELCRMGVPALMSGSGATVFGLIPDGGQDLAERVAATYREKKGYQVFLTSTL